MSSIRLEAALGLSTSSLLKMPRMSSTRLVPYQILIKSRNLPFSWERFIIIKEFVEVNVNGVQKVVVSVKDCLVATRILYAEHEVMEVSREAIGKKGCEFVG